jgi:biotin carboxylase
MREAFVVAGGSMSQRGLLDRAHELGYAVCVIDGSPSAPLFQQAEFAVLKSFADVRGVVESLREQEIAPVAVATMGSDQAVLPTAELADRLHLPGLSLETARAVSDKRRMRDAFERNGVPCAAGREACDLEELERAWDELGPPLVVKPVDGSAQRGVTRVDSRDELAAAFARAQKASKQGVAVAERYLEGEEYTINGFCLDGDYFPVTVTLRRLHDPPPVGVCVAHVYPSGLSDSLERAAFDVAEAASDAVGLKTGPSYVQVRLDGSEWSVIEVGARLGGGKDAELAWLVTGFDAVGAAVKAALGTLERDDLHPDPTARIAPHGQVQFVVAPPGRIVRLDASPALALEGVHEAGFYWPEGGVLPPLRSGAERLGYVLLTAESPEQLAERTRLALETLDVEIVQEQALV